MLRHLHIENYALIKSLDICFDDRFTVITGETGAGKSIILGALSLILGNRADSTALHNKEKKCYIEGEFDISTLNLQFFFENHCIDYDSPAILRREINELGKSRAFINDTPVTLPVLKEFALHLLDIHSQHQNLLFTNSSFRINILDQFAGNEKCLKEYLSLFTQYDKGKKELQQLLEAQFHTQQEKQFSEFLLQELEEAHLESGEQERIEEQIRVLSYTELIQSNLFQANQILSEEDLSVIPLLKKMAKNLETISLYDSHIQSISERVNDIILNLQDISFELARMGDTSTLNPELIVSLQERLDKIYFLQQKHQLKTVDELIEKANTLRKTLLNIEDNNERITHLEKQQKELFQATLDKAHELSSLRSSKINSFSDKIMQTLKELGMENSAFSIKIEKEKELSQTGADHVQFLFSANKGIPVEEIGKVASGGELSRLMLAVKSIITQESLLPTILFDEIDAGISGETAGKVATMMENISSFCQLITITHLPQIAAKGKKHYYVYKETIDNTTFTKIKELDNDERITEIAKMMSGEEVSASARKVASELLNNTKIKN